MSSKMVLIDELEPDGQKSYAVSTRLKVFEGVLTALSTMIAFGCLVWVAIGGPVLVVISTLIALSLAIFVTRYFVASYAMENSYATTYEGGMRLRESIIRHLTRLPLGAFRKLHAGKVAHTLSEEMMWLENQTCFFRPDTLAQRSTILGLFAGVAILHWPSAVAAAVVWAAGLLALRKLSGMLDLGLRFRSAGIAEASQHFMEFAEGIQVIRAFGSTDEAEKDYRKWIEIIREGFRKGIKRNTPVASLFIGLATSAAGVGCLIGVLTLPSNEAIIRVAAAVGLLTATIIPARALVGNNGVAKLAEIGVENIQRMQDLDEVTQGELIAETGPAEITFDRVSFSYDEHKTALSEISFSAAPGTITAIVGRSGAGKTTLANLMLRFWDFDQGQIALNGRDIRDFTIASYMNRFAVVFQETTLFRDTIVNNIRVGNPSASMDEVIAAAKAAQIHDTIELLPSGYEEMIGPAGSTLSGGERQRVAIARALLKDADIVILDEATSALDPENEREIQLAFEALARNKTVFVIAHRLSTIVEADNILLLDEGRLVNQGKHRQLMVEDDLYRSLWESYQAISKWTL